MANGETPCAVESTLYTSWSLDIPLSGAIAAGATADWMHEPAMPLAWQSTGLLPSLGQAQPTFPGGFVTERRVAQIWRATSGNEWPRDGYLNIMTEPRDEERIRHRAELTPEEQEAGSDDPEAQAAAILRESDERVADPEGTRRESTQTPDEPVPEEDLNR